MTEPMNDANPLSPSSSPAPARSGSIALVGIGPGHAAHMTARAREAIAQADVVIGYVTYIKLVADLLEGKEVIRKAMTEEIDRAISALEKARQGKKVALISSVAIIFFLRFLAFHTANISEEKKNMPP